MNAQTPDGDYRPRKGYVEIVVHLPQLNIRETMDVHEPTQLSARRVVKELGEIVQERIRAGE